MLPKPLDEINNTSQAIQSALSFDNLKDAIGFICNWEEYHRKKMGFKESFSGFCVQQLLFVYGIDINKIGRR